MPHAPFGSGTEDIDAWVTGGAATASTRLSAFDAALASGGIHDANLLGISSIVPAEATFQTDVAPQSLAERIQPGALVPAIYARAESQEPGQTLHAAVAGVRLEAGYGLIAEGHGVGEPRSAVRRRCEETLAEMARTREQARAGDPWVHLASTTLPEASSSTWAGAVAAVVFL